MSMPILQPGEAKQLADLPNTWIRKRLRYLSSRPIRNGLGEAANDDNPEHPRYIRITDIASTRELRSDTFRSLPPEVAIAAQVQEHDILISAVGATYGKSFYAERLEGDACFAGYLVRLSPAPGMHPSFLAYWTESRDYWAQVDANVIQATIQNFSAAKVRHLNAPVPPLETQRRIARLLDEKTARIDGLIENKRALLDRLAEKRQALISRAVTKGLDPTAPMKPSGIDWLGDIPEHWEIRGLTKCTIRIDYRGATPEKSSAGIFLVTAKNIKHGEIDYEASKEYIPEQSYEHVMRRGKPDIGDVLFTTEAPLGEVARVDRTDIALAQRIIKFSSAIDELSNDYLAYWMYSSPFQADVLSRATGSTALGIKASKIVELRCLLPPLREQKEIAGFLDDDAGSRSVVASQIEASVRHLREYRDALISSAVTGQISELQ